MASVRTLAADRTAMFDKVCATQTNRQTKQLGFTAAWITGLLEETEGVFNADEIRLIVNDKPHILQKFTLRFRWGMTFSAVKYRAFGRFSIPIR